MSHSRHPGTIDGPQGSAIFVHIPRTGGHAVHDAMGGRSSHLSALQHRNILGHRYGECFVFSIVRNPWDHAVSWYTNMSEGRTVQGFREWVQLGCPQCMVKYRGGVCGNGVDQMSFIENGGDVHVWKFPDIDDAVKMACIVIGKPVAKPKIVNRTNARACDYTTYYDTPTRDAIAELRQREINQYGWRFGEDRRKE